MSKNNTSHEEHAELCSAFEPGASAQLAPRISEDRKWVAVSMLQKSIRRSRPDLAVAWARALWDADRNYGTFRMAVIASEEIACADPALARGFLQSEIKKGWFDERGGFCSLAYFAAAFARSTKDRTSCDLSACASLSRLEGVAEAKGSLDYKRLRSAALDPGRPIPARVAALWLLAGTQKIPNSQLGAPRPGRLTDFLGTCAELDPDADSLACAELSLRLNQEPNSIALSLCRQASKSGFTIVDGLVSPVRTWGPGLTAGLDAHTREGRLALEDLLAESDVAQHLCASMRSKADKSKLLGVLFFRLEGHEATPRMDYELARRSTAWHEARVGSLCQMEPHEAFAAAASLLPRLDELRMARAPWAFEAPRQVPKP